MILACGRRTKRHFQSVVKASKENRSTYVLSAIILADRGGFLLHLEQINAREEAELRRKLAAQTVCQR
jgi:hypothetical protein